MRPNVKTLSSELQARLISSTVPTLQIGCDRGELLERSLAILQNLRYHMSG